MLRIYNTLSNQIEEFKPIEEYKSEGLPIPDFPSAESWSELANFESKYGNYKINIIENVKFISGSKIRIKRKFINRENS